MKHTICMITAALLALLPFVRVMADSSVTTEQPTDATQTRVTLQAAFADGSTENGFQYKYGTIPGVGDFFKYLATATCDPLTITQGSTAWNYVARQKWVESPASSASTFNAEFSTTVTLTKETTISFDWQVSSEENIGKLQFYVDGTAVESITGETDFATVTYSLCAGSHTLKWAYSRSSAEYTGLGIGRVKNLNVQNTTAGTWIDAPATGSSLRLTALYPSQQYLFRAYSKVGGDTVYSDIKQFETTSVSIGIPTVTTTQTTATLSCDVSSDVTPIYNIVYGKKKTKKKCNSLEQAILPYGERDSTLIDFKFNGNWSKYTSSNGIITRNNNANITASFVLSKTSIISFGWEATAYDTYNGANIAAYCYVDNQLCASLLWDSWYGYSNNHGAELTLTPGKHTIVWTMNYPYSTTDYFRLTSVTIPNVSVFSELGDTIENVSFPYKKKNLTPNTEYAAYIDIIPDYYSELEQRWPLEHSEVIRFTTKNIIIQTDSVTNLKQASATLNGSFDGGDATIVAKGIQYRNVTGTRWSNVTTTADENKLTGSIRNLRPATAYQWRTYVQVQGCDTVFSSTNTFTTDSVCALKPVMLNVTQHTAKMRGEVRVGDAIIYARGLQFRVQGASEWENIEDFTEDDAYVIDKKNLAINTTYEARTYVQQAGSEFVYSDILKFATKNIEVFVDSITDVWQRTVVVHGRVSPGDDNIAQKKVHIYKVDGVNVVEIGDMMVNTSDTVFSQKIMGLEPNVKYGFIIEAVNNTGITVFSGDVEGLKESDESLCKTLLSPQSSTNVVTYYKDGIYATFNLEEPTDISFSWSVRGYFYNYKTKVTDLNSIDCYVDGILYKSISARKDAYAKKEDVTISLSSGRHSLRWVKHIHSGGESEIEIGNLLVPTNAVSSKQRNTCVTSVFFNIDGLLLSSITQTYAKLQVGITETNEENVTYYVKSLENKIIDGLINNDILMAELMGLTQNTKYTYYAVAKTADGKEYASEAITFKTSAVGVNISTSNVTQTTATVKVTTDAGTATISNMQYRLDYGSWQTLTDGKATFTGLSPNTSYRVEVQWTVNGSTYSNSISFMTESVELYAGWVSAEQTSALVTMGSYTVGTATWKASGIVFRDETYPLIKGETFRLTGLNHGVEYRYTYFVETLEGGRIEKTGYFRTKSITTVTSPATSISNRSATLNGKIECDAYSGAEFGFQWKTKQNWTTDPRFTKGRKNDDGTISVSLVNGMLNPDTEYQFRTAVRYGKYSDDTDVYYYGEWRDFRTESEFVIYPATPYTMYRTDSENNRLVLCGYYVAGSEDVVSQGYEYWRGGSANAKGVVSSYATAVEKNVITTDGSMEASIDLSTLDAGTYVVQAFVKTATATYYGQQLSFSVGTPDAIEGVYGEEPVCMTSHNAIVLRNVENLHVRIADMAGRTLYSGRCESNMETYSVPGGIYIVQFGAGCSKKVIVK